MCLDISMYLFLSHSLPDSTPPHSPLSTSLPPATRETAILNAYMSAGVAHSIASACHENTIEGCACIAGPTIREDGVTYLQSCADNVDFAITFLKQFYGIESSNCERDLVDKWNNILGYDVSVRGRKSR